MIATNVLRATIKLFDSIPLTDNKVIDRTPKDYEDFNRYTITSGFLVSKNVYDSQNGNLLQETVAEIRDIYGLSGEQLNASFHKSWEKIRSSSLEQLYAEQLAHYITTYGFQALGVYNEDSVYFPTEELNIPEIEEDKIILKVFKGITKKEIKEKLSSLLSSGIALKEETLDDILTLAIYTDFNSFDLESVKNKEAKVRLLKELGLTPNNASEFLRYVIYRITDSTLVIQNSETINDIKLKGIYPEDFEADTISLLFKDFYKKSGSYVEFAKIFNRYKKIFLAFKTHHDMKPIINKISKMSKTFHEPMKRDLLNDLTGMIKKQETIHYDELKDALDNVNIFRKIRLAQALSFRANEESKDTYKLYKIRNGKSFIKPFKYDDQKTARLYFGIVISHIAQDIEEKVKGKTILLSKNLQYGLPNSEKQFTGNLPSGSFVDLVDENMLIGVNWFNINKRCIDLDLSGINAEGKIGWDGSYRSNHILFSGDITDAAGKYGATETFFVDKDFEGTYAFYLNWFNWSDKISSCPFKLFIGTEIDNTEIKEKGRNYMVDPNKIVSFSNSEIERKQKLIGFVHGDKEKLRFYFSESDVGSSISARRDQAADVIRDMKINFDFYSLNEILKLANVKIVYEKTEDVEIDIDLSYENVSKETIIELLTKETE